jgi:anti-sigma regulatory factor (Ser/Thr protein kinase)
MGDGAVRKGAMVSIPSHPRYLCVIRDAAVRMARIAGIGEARIEDIRLAVDEACSNVIKHAYGGDTTGKIVVKFRKRKDGFEVVIEDDGMKTDLAAVHGRDLDDVRPGGLGVHFIRRTFDEVSFDPDKKRGNRLRLFAHADKQDAD